MATSFVASFLIGAVLFIAGLYVPDVIRALVKMRAEARIEDARAREAEARAKQAEEDAERAKQARINEEIRALYKSSGDR